MSTAYEPIKLTYHDYVLLPEDRRVELIDGSFLLTPAPNTKHQRISREIEVRIHQWVAEKRLGEVFDAPTAVVLSEFDVVQPDILFVAKEHKAMIKDACIEGSPDLVVEILSPGSEKRDMETKKHLYSKFGVREYWIVDPEQETITLLVFEKNQLVVKQVYPKGSHLESPVLSGFRLDTGELFSPPVWL